MCVGYTDTLDIKIQPIKIIIKMPETHTNITISNISAIAIISLYHNI